MEQLVCMVPRTQFRLMDAVATAVGAPFVVQPLRAQRKYNTNGKLNNSFRGVFEMMNDNRMEKFLFAIEGVGAVFVGIFLAAYWVVYLWFLKQSFFTRFLQ